MFLKKCVNILSNATRYTTIFIFIFFLQLGTPLFGQIQEYDLVDTLIIRSDGQPTTSKVVLMDGVEYRIRASGEIPVGGGAFGDAEYLFRHNPDGSHVPAYSNAPSIQTQCPGDVQTDIGIAINDARSEVSKFPFWGAFEDSHVYTISQVGKGNTITLSYHDCIFTDNMGFLTVEIFKPVVKTQDPWTYPLTLTVIGAVIASATGVIIKAMVDRSKRC